MSSEQPHKVQCLKGIQDLYAASLLALWEAKGHILQNSLLLAAISLTFPLANKKFLIPWIMADLFCQILIRKSFGVIVQSYFLEYNFAISFRRARSFLKSAL